MEEDQFMMPTRVNDQTPVPPPAYHRAQAKLGPALHIDALTLITTLHLLTLCRWLCAWRIGVALPRYQQVQEGLRARTAKSHCCLSCSYGRYGDSPMEICAIGCVTGLPLPWHVTCRWEKIAYPVFPVPRSNASAAIEQELRCQKHSLSSASWSPSVLG